MLANQISFQNKLVLFNDSFGLEKHSLDILKGILLQQNNLDKSRFLKYDDLNKEINTLSTEILVLPLVSEMLVNKTPSFVFNLINKMMHNRNIKQIFLWITKPSIHYCFVIPFLNYMADQIITITNSEFLSVLTRKNGGLVTNKMFKYYTSTDGLLIESFKESKIIKESIDNSNPKSIGTFKIELEEEEMIARNALKLPYEKAKEYEGDIIYTPDIGDDFDDEDPDEDLSV